MAGQDNTGAHTGRDHGQAPTDGQALIKHDVRPDVPQQRDHVRELTAVVTAALRQRSKLEPVIVDRMHQRAELYEKAHVQARQAAIDMVEQGGPPAERHARQLDALRKPDLEILPAEMLVKLAASDARLHGALRDPEHRAAATLAMANMASLSAGYRAALASKSPAVSTAVETAIAASEASRPGRAVATSGDKSDTTPEQADTTPLRGPAMTLDPQAPERTAAQRARDANMVAEQPGLNSIEQVIRQKRETRPAPSEETGAAPREPVAMPAQGTSKRARGDNQVSADEVFTASRDDGKPIVPVEVEDKYLRVGSKFYHPKNTHVVAFEDKGNKLETRSNSEQIAGAMVAIARARGWDEIKVAGSETFRREVWLEAAAHGMHVKGYAPSEVDKAELARRNRDVEVHRMALDDRGRAFGPRANAVRPSHGAAQPIDKAKEGGQAERADDEPKSQDRQRAQAFARRSAADALADYPELAGAYAARASIDRKVDADALSPRQRAVVMARVEANLVNSIERGLLPQLKVRAPQEPVEARHEPVKERER